MNHYNKSELTAQWWQFFLEDKRVPSVYFIRGRIDVLGDKSIHQTDDLVESDKLIVMPIDNWISLKKRPILRNREKIEQEMIELAKTKMNRTVKLTLTIDGQDVDVPKTRVMSPFFNILLTKKNIPVLRTLEVNSEIVSPGAYQAISDGYWLFIEPNTLKHGRHKIETFGSCATGLFELAMHHYISTI